LTTEEASYAMKKTKLTDEQIAFVFSQAEIGTRDGGGRRKMGIFEAILITTGKRSFMVSILCHSWSICKRIMTGTTIAYKSIMGVNLYRRYWISGPMKIVWC